MAHPRAERRVKSPTPQQIRKARERAGHTQTQAAAVVHVALRTWQSWEDEGQSRRDMPAGLWELYLIKTGAGHDSGGTHVPPRRTS